MILILDNYDSFTHNIYQYLKEITDVDVKVVRSDKITIEQVEKLSPSHIVISPGPGRPEEAGISEEAIIRFAGRIPILGICLGHQAIGHAFGGRIIGAKEIVHGKVQDISTDGRGVFRGIPSPTKFTRYHSLVIDETSLPAELEITARSPDGEIMGVRHKDFLIEGVQFHPESIASEGGKKLLKNFLHYSRESFDASAILSKLIDKVDLSQAEAMSFMEELTDGNLNDIQIAAFLTAFTTKGATASEIAGCAHVLQKKRTPISSSRPCLDTCGTGGDGLHTFNISSLAALVASACGAQVAKHGNRGVSSPSGSADFYSSLGYNISVSPKRAEEILEEQGFSFLFAPSYHGAMKYAAPARKALKVKTIMNLMGPLVNPALASYQLIGVYHPSLCGPMAEAAKLLGVKRVLVVHGTDGMDEISVTHPSIGVMITEDGDVEDLEIRPESFGIGPYQTSDLKGGDAHYNALLAKKILQIDADFGNVSFSDNQLKAISDSVALNAGAALFVAGIAHDFQDGFTMAKAAMTDGTVAQKLETVVKASQS